MANEKDITVPVSLDEKTFKRFARFDMLALRKRWIRPALFMLLLMAFAIAALLTRKPQSGMIAAVLLAVGLALPLVYIGTFLSQVNLQAEKQKLGKGRRVYTVMLTRGGITVTNDQKKEEALNVAWQDAKFAYRRKDCIYLYVSAARAFLLPEGQANAPQDDVWKYLLRHMGDQKCKKI
ncbi:MAG: hypothetical protein IJ157_08900 [Clostridia bacterium]|nr:hypothetical protein [Clostridia bacterium]